MTSVIKYQDNHKLIVSILKVPFEYDCELGTITLYQHGVSQELCIGDSLMIDEYDTVHVIKHRNST